MLSVKKKTQEQRLQDKHFYVQGYHFHCRVVLTKILLVDID